MAIKIVDIEPPRPVKKPLKKRGAYLAGKTAEKTKPWETEGVSRRTWYRKRKQDMKK